MVKINLHGIPLLVNLICVSWSSLRLWESIVLFKTKLILSWFLGVRELEGLAFEMKCVGREERGRSDERLYMNPTLHIILY